MPFKDIKLRRKSYMKWVKKHREQHRLYQRILYISKKNNPIPKKCKIRGCSLIGERHHPDYSKPEKIEWLCRFHHKRIKHSSKCKICGDKVTGRGLCNKHYKRERCKDFNFVLRKRDLMKLWRIKRKALGLKRD